MKKILDDNFNNNPPNLTNQEKGLLRSEIRNIEEKNWYGTILICIVIGLILVSTIVMTYELGFSLPLILINGLLIIVHLILLYLAKSDKLLAYTGAFITFIFTIVSNMLLTETSIFGKVIWTIAIFGSYLIFIYEEVKLKKLKTKLADAGED